MLENKVLTWDNFLKRGGMGPNIYILCYIVVESSHLKVRYPFTLIVWQEVKNALNIDQIWDFQNIYSSFKQWIIREHNWRALPYFICWEVWKHRNRKLFEGKHVGAWLDATRGIIQFKEWFKEKIQKRMKIKK